MAQHDYFINNDLGASVRTDLNAALAAISSTNMGNAAPPTTYPGMLWLDTLSPETLKLRNAQGKDWLPVAVGAGFLPLAGGTINGNLVVAGIFHDDDFDKLRVNYASDTAPSPTYAGMLWYDTTTTAGKLRIMNAANNGWLDVANFASPNYYDQVTIYSAAGNAQLNLTSKGERRRIVGNQAAKRWDFYGPTDQFLGCISDAGDFYMAALGQWASTYLNGRQDNIGFTPVRQYDGTLIHIGGNPAHLWVNNVDQGVINTSNNQGFFNLGDLGSYALLYSNGGSSYNQLASGTAISYYPDRTQPPGTWRCMEYQVASGSVCSWHRVA